MVEEGLLNRVQQELEEARAELEDNAELRRAFLGQTGVHIGIRILNSARRQFDREEARLKERIALLEKLLNNCDGR